MRIGERLGATATCCADPVNDSIRITVGLICEQPALLLLGAPVTAHDLRQHPNARGNTRQLRADLQAWAADALTQHRTFHDTFLHGCSAHEGIALAALGGVDVVREEIGAFVGIVVGAELRRLRAVGPAIAAVDWAAHDEEWEGAAAGAGATNA